MSKQLSLERANRIGINKFGNSSPFQLYRFSKNGREGRVVMSREAAAKFIQRVARRALGLGKYQFVDIYRDRFVSCDDAGLHVNFSEINWERIRVVPFDIVEICERYGITFA